ncbi:cytochrome C [Methylomicrobium lacus]|uniref:cytochrome C n=1 Tax=Methylomicrobium lacus TaxID=136992 RepID=UPI0035A96A31
MKSLHAKKLALGLAASMAAASVQADEFTKDDLERWQGQFMEVVKQGRELWTSPTLGTNGVACAQCHPNAANTHPETYPKFQKQIGKVIPLWEMINWCLRNPLEGQPLAADDPKMVALQAYVTYERRGVKLEPGKH